MSEPSSQNVSVEQNGRVLTGGPGTSLEALEQAVDRSEGGRPESESAPREVAAAPTSDGIPQADSKPLKGRERYQALTHERDEERRRATEANQRAIDLASRLEALEQRTAQAGKQEPPEASQPPPVSASSATRAKPSEDEVGTKYQNYAEFVEDLTDWKSEQREVQAERQRERLARAARWHEKHQAALQQYPDYDDALANGAGTQIHLGPTEEVGEARIRTLIDTQGGEHVIYKLAKDPEAAHRVAALNDFEFGMFVKSLMPLEPAAQPVQRASKAPAPYQPVNGGGRTSATSSAEAAAKGNFDEYRLKRAAERGVKPKYR